MQSITAAINCTVQLHAHKSNQPESMIHGSETQPIMAAATKCTKTETEKIDSCRHAE